MTDVARSVAVPATIGPYRVITRIASGGMAEVYLATRRGVAGFERAVVIKRMLPHLADQADLRSALLDEARLMACLRHPNIVNVHELSRDDESELYLVMEYLRGESIAELRRQMLGRNERLDAALAVHIVSEMCAGLHAAHELRDDEGRPLNVVHRDVSPQNVIVTFDGEVKILDFGIACFDSRAGRTQTGVTKGKFAYMSPEQYMGEKVDRRADVFAAGAILHELLTGKRLFARESDAQVLKAVLHDPIPLPSQVADDSVLVPEELDEICMCALARNRDERHPTAAALREALRELMPRLDPRQRARERLVELTRRVLPHRFEETEELLRRAARASAVTLPAIAAVSGRDTEEISIEVKVPEISRSTAAEPVPRARAARRSRGARLVTALTIGGAVAMAGLLAASAWRGAATSRDGATALDSLAREGAAGSRAVRPVVVSPTASAPRTGDERAAAAPAVPATVRVHVATSPPGATVTIGGERRGTTPVALDVARGSAPVDLLLELAGHERIVEPVVPEVDQRVSVRLAPLRAPLRARRRSRPRFHAFE